MLLAALGFTLCGFVLLIAAVYTGEILWAWACIGVGVLGLLMLLVDVIRSRGASGGEEPSTDGAGSDGAAEAVVLDAGADGAAPGAGPDPRTESDASDPAPTG